MRLPPSLPFWIVFAACIAAIAVWKLFAPRLSTEQSPAFYMLLITGLLVVLFVTMTIFWPPPSRCSLFYGPVRELQYDEDWNVKHYRTYNTQCGRNAVGSVCTTKPDRRKEHFCESHDPEFAWMQEWMRSRGIAVDVRTIKRFPFDEYNDYKV